MYFVYALTDPRTDIVAYVGITNNPNARLQEHISCTGSNDERKTWIRKLQEEGCEPRMKILEVADTKKEALAYEKHWVQYYISLGISVTNIYSKPKTSKPKTISQSQASDSYYTASEAVEKLNASGIGLSQGKTFRDIFPRKRRIKEMLDMTYGVLMDHVRAGRIRSVVPPGEHQAVFNKEDVDRLSQPEKNYYTAKEAQEMLGMTYSALGYQVDIGNIHSFIPPGERRPVYSKETVDQLSREIKVFWGKQV